MNKNKSKFTDLMYKHNENVNHKRNFLNFGLLGLQKFLDIDKYLYKFLIVLFLSIVMGVVNCLLIERTGIYTPGINALHQAIARCVKTFMDKNSEITKYVYIFLFWGLNIIFNLIFAIFCFKKIGKSFTSLTVLYITCLSLTGVGLSLILKTYGSDEFYIFSNPKSENSTLINNNIQLLPWPTATYKEDGYKVLIIFVYGFIYSIINSIVSLIIYSIDGGMGGLDWIVFYLYKVKKYSSNKLFFISGLIISLLAYVIGTYIPFLIKAGDGINERLPNLFSPTFLATILMIFTKKILFNNYYSQFKLVKVKVFTNKYFEIRHKLLAEKFPHSFTITNSVGSYKLRHQTQLEFICFSVELSNLIKSIREVDKDCLIVATKINIISGYLQINQDLE